MPNSWTACATTSDPASTGQVQRRAVVALWVLSVLLLVLAHGKIMWVNDAVSLSRYPIEDPLRLHARLAFFFFELALLMAIPTHLRVPAAVGIDFVLTTVAFVDVVHQRFYGDIASAGGLFNLPEAPAGGLASVLLTPELLLFADLPVALVLAWLVRRSMQGAAFGPRPRRRVLLSCAALALGGVAAASSVVRGVRQDRDQIYDYMVQRVEVAAHLGLLGYHAFDAYVFVRHSLLGELTTTEAQRDHALATLEARRRAELDRSPLFGVARGKNLIVIMAESLADFPIGLEIDGQQVTPNLNALAGESIRFTNVFDQTHMSTTADAEVLALHSLYPLPASAVQTRFAGHSYRGLPGVLAAQGYGTFSAHGNDGDFWNRGEFHRRLGFQRSHFKEEFPGKVIGLGLADRDFMRGLAPLITAHREPFFALGLSVTSHFDYGLPDEEKELVLPSELEATVTGRYLHTVRYLDRALGELVAELRRKGVLDRSVLAIFGDHRACGMDMPREYAQLLRFSHADKLRHFLVKRRIAMLVRLPGGAHAQVRPEAGGEVDIAPTLLSLLGVDPTAMSVALGHDLLRDRERRVFFRDGTIMDGGWLFRPGMTPARMPDVESRPVPRRLAVLEAMRDAELQASDTIISANLIPELTAALERTPLRTPDAAASRPRPRPRPRVIAHRGDPAHLPENTLGSIESARGAGVDLIAADVGLTRDGAAVLLHEGSLRAAGCGPIASTTLARLREVDVGRWKAPRFAGFPVPTLAEALRPSGAPLLLDPSAPGSGAAIAAALREAGRTPQEVVACARDEASLVDLATHLAGARLVWTGDLPAEGVVDRLRALAGRGVIAVLTRDLAPSRIAAAHHAGLQVWTGPINDEERLATALRLGVDGIETDDPRWLIARLDGHDDPVLPLGLSASE